MNIDGPRMQTSGYVCYLGVDGDCESGTLLSNTATRPVSLSLGAPIIALSSSKCDSSKRWETLVEKLILSKNRQINWDDFKIQNLLPQEILVKYEDIEKSRDIKFTMSSKRLYYSEFTKASSCFKSSSQFNTLNRGEVDFLIRVTLRMDIPDYVLRDLITAKLEESRKVRFDFSLFISLICDVMTYQQQKLDPPIGAYLKMFELPVDPDSDGKQIWDLFVLSLLMYCSFSVPYSVTFLDTDSPSDTLSNIEVFIDSLFLFDMLLSFLTAYEEKGFVVRDLRRISVHYLQTWFLLDFAGSFPFDRVLQLIATTQPGVSSTNLLRALRFIRLLKLLRGVRLLSKLSHLAQKEGLENFSGLIGIVSAVYLLVFVAHTLGCIFTLLIGVDESENWLEHYNPALVDAENFVRYVVAVYWAIVTITTTGYGDVLPVTETERLFAIFVALLGAVVFSYSVGTISLLVSQVPPPFF